jgi:chromosomal replication initiation ATPase DnaA
MKHIKLKKINNQETTTLVKQLVSIELQIPLSDINGSSRKREIADARSIAIAIGWKKLDVQKGLIQYGKYFNMTHASILAAFKKVESLFFTDKSFKDKYNRCLERCCFVSSELIQFNNTPQI